jgi:ATP-dependent Clp protease ATP-binding subunit ClpA
MPGGPWYSPNRKPPGHIPFTPRAKKVLELSLREAIGLGHDHIGSEHILLGLIREGEGMAVQVLQRKGIELEVARQAVSKHLAGESYQAEPRSGREHPNCPRCRGALALSCRTMAMQSSDMEVMVIFCQVCGATLGVHPA